MYLSKAYLDDFNDLFSAFYSCLYDDVLTVKKDYISLFEYAMTDSTGFFKAFVNAFIEYRQDPLTSDREITAFCLAYMSIENNIF